MTKMSLFLMAGSLFLCGVLLPKSVIGAEDPACMADFQRLCPQMPSGAKLYTLCFAEHYTDLSPVCRQKLAGLSHSPEEAAFSVCQENAKGHSEMLDAPSSADDVRFMRCGVSDKVTFRVHRAFPDPSIVDLMQKRWEAKGWFPQPGADDSWKEIMSPDHLRIAVIREFFCKNVKGQMALLILAYYQKFQDPLIEGTPLETIGLNDDLHVIASLTPVRRNWDGKLPVLFGHEIQIK